MTGVAARRTTPSVGLPAAWWPIAYGKEVGRHPKAFRLGSRDLAVYRDLDGVVRAVDDACPHRRLPLSMGRITEDGYLQCAYHGWCFDGATGQCTAIPNLSNDERVPRGIRVAAFTTAENVADALGFGLRTPILAPAVGQPTGEEPEGGTAMFDTTTADGLILVWTGTQEPPDSAPATAPGLASGTTITDTVEVRAAHRDLAEALLYNPGATLGLASLLGAGDEICGPIVRTAGDTVTVHRQRLAHDLPRPSTFGPLSRRVVASTTTTACTTGLTRVEAPGCRVVAALTPLGPYRTVLRRRTTIEGRGARLRTGLSTLASVGRRLVHRAPERAEAQADRVAQRLDDGLDVLRALRLEEA